MNASQTFQTATERLHLTDRSLWLGQLVWYGVSDVLIEHTVLVQALAATGLSGYIPRLPSDVDVFRRVCTRAQKKRQPTLDPDVYENYLIRDIPMDGDEVIKVLVRETVSPGNLGYETQLCHIIFNKTTSAVSYDAAIGDAVTTQIMSDITATYEAERGTLNSYAVRELIRKILMRSNAINVRGSGGGVYFVSHDYLHTVEKLERFAAMMPGTVLFHTVPLLDDGKQREMVRRAYESETVEEVQRLVDEIATLAAALERAGDRVASSKVAHYMRQLEVARGKVKEYDSLMESTSDTARSALDIFQRQILKLASLVAP